MDIEVGDIITGKVTGITKFGAFVTVASGKSGLVHISEIAHTFVNDVSEHLAVGQEVSVKVLGAGPGKLNLSIKAATAPQFQSRPPRTGPAPRGNPAPRPRQDAAPEAGYAEQSFEDRLKRFMQDSDSKISGLRMYSDRKSSRRRSN
ncbi:MAG: S1 RNA-binding domain-containing protein [Oscillospiraceae bacterium]|nr:S1 RNA-binding domain-containing protein [Oscillospiraceae bacterium]